MPSPAMATLRPSPELLDDLALLVRQHLGFTSSIPSRPATASAVVRLSPVNMTMRTLRRAEAHRLGRGGP